MNKKRVAWLAVGFVALAASGYVVFRDYLPPATPRATARRLTGLAVPRNSVVDEFKEEWTRLGTEGRVTVKLRIEPERFDQLLEQARQKGFISLPVRKGPTTYGALERFAVPSASGLYLVDDKPGEKSLIIIVLDRRTYTLIVEQTVM